MTKKPFSVSEARDWNAMVEFEKRSLENLRDRILGQMEDQAEQIVESIEEGKMKRHARVSFSAESLRARALGMKSETRRTLRPSNTFLRVYRSHQVAPGGKFNGEPLKMKRQDAWVLWNEHGVSSDGSVIELRGQALNRVCSKDGKLFVVSATPMHRPGDLFTWKEETRAVHVSGSRVEVIYTDGEKRIREVDDEKLADVIQRQRNGGEKIVARYMPQWRARFVDEIQETWFERVGAINHEGAVAEGIARWAESHGWGRSIADCLEEAGEADGWGTPRDAYARAWDALHGEGSFAKNPWVLVYRLKPADRGSWN